MFKKMSEQNQLKLFQELSFDEQKWELLSILKELNGVSNTVDVLWKAVFSVQWTDTKWIFSDVYALLLEAIDFAKNKQEENVIAKLGQSKKLLTHFLEEEKNEKTNDERALEWMINNI